MFELLESLPSLIGNQPWWAITLQILLLLLVLCRYGVLQINIEMGPRRRFKDLLQPPIRASATTITLQGIEADRFQQFLREGKKIEAIKLLRSKENLNLEEAKNIVDLMSLRK